MHAPAFCGRAPALAGPPGRWRGRRAPRQTTPPSAARPPRLTNACTRLGAALRMGAPARVPTIKTLSTWKETPGTLLPAAGWDKARCPDEPRRLRRGAGSLFSPHSALAYEAGPHTLACVLARRAHTPPLFCIFSIRQTGWRTAAGSMDDPAIRMQHVCARQAACCLLPRVENRSLDHLSHPARRRRAAARLAGLLVSSVALPERRCERASSLRAMTTNARHASPFLSQISFINALTYAIHA
ncbi:MAG: hypothetical protein J3K34DRAFT_440758 [Monoraphidium minutum]|nr:MAG: hypothetical protein J3K34DRAFT_440758 [Monoraphidium minutum]